MEGVRSISKSYIKKSKLVYIILLSYYKERDNNIERYGFKSINNSFQLKVSNSSSTGVDDIKENDSKEFPSKKIYKKRKSQKNNYISNKDNTFLNQCFNLSSKEMDSTYNTVGQYKFKNKKISINFESNKYDYKSKNGIKVDKDGKNYNKDKLSDSKKVNVETNKMKSQSDKKVETIKEEKNKFMNMINLKKEELKPYPPKSPLLYGDKYKISGNEEGTFNNYYKKMNRSIIPHAFYNHIMINDNRNNIIFCHNQKNKTICLTNRNKGKLITILYYSPLTSI